MKFAYKIIHIPIKEERVEVTKKTVVDDEVVIRKDKHKENQTVTETVKHEDIEVEGDAEVRNDGDLKKGGLNDPIGATDLNMDTMDRDPLRDDSILEDLSKEELEDNVDENKRI